MGTSIGTLTGLIIPRVPAWRRRAAAGAERRTAPGPAAAPPPTHEERLLAHLSRDLGVPAATLKAQRDRTHLGWGDLLIANRLAQKTGLPFRQVARELERDALFHIIWSAFAARRLGRDCSSPEGG